MEILKVENLKKTYGKGNTLVKALDGISFTVNKGEFVAIVGASGSGKSTLLHLLGGVDRPTSGKIIIDGEKSHIIPNGFRAMIPAGTEILDLKLENKILTINFSKDLLTINEKDEEKMIEAIIYSLTSIEGIDKVVIQVEGKVLEKLPHSQKNILYQNQQ